METVFTFIRLGRNLFCAIALLITTVVNGQTKYIVEASNTVFAPNMLTIDVGDTVEWHNVEGWHNVDGQQSVFPDNPVSFGNEQGSGWVYSFVFTVAGTYNYHCDPHASLGMTGQIEVRAANTDTEYTLTLHLSDMNPHVGQTLYLSVADKNSGVEVGREMTVISTDFSIDVSGIEKDHSYYVNFFADFNENGMYDAPPTDHAWQLVLESVQGDTTLNFTHNTNFTDIMWENKLTLQFHGMNPHDGQTFGLWVKNKGTGTELFSTEVTATPEFDIVAYGIKKGESYNIDFYADHNGNGAYDAPPADHAWRIELNNVQGDTVIDFTHNISFTNIFDATAIESIVEQTFKMYPNPAENLVTLEYSGTSKGLKVRVFDLAGRLQSIRSIVFDQSIQMDLQDLSRGIYLVEIQDENLSKTHKLIKE